MQVPHAAEAGPARISSIPQEGTGESYGQRDRTGEALVGGSYILFEESAVVRSNVWLVSEDDHKVSGRSFGNSLLALYRRETLRIATR